MKNKIRIFFILFSLFFFQSCNKREYTCSRGIDYDQPVGVAFVGYTPDELDTIIVAHYKGETNLTQLMGTDTLISPDSNMLAFHDTLIFWDKNPNRYSGFWQVQAGVDDRAILPSTKDTFTITGAISDMSSYSWRSKSECSMAGAERLPIRNIHINGDSVVADQAKKIGNEFNAYIYLKK